MSFKDLGQVEKRECPEISQTGARLFVVGLTPSLSVSIVRTLDFWVKDSQWILKRNTGSALSFWQTPEKIHLEDKRFTPAQFWGFYPIPGRAIVGNVNMWCLEQVLLSTWVCPWRRSPVLRFALPDTPIMRWPSSPHRGITTMGLTRIAPWDLCFETCSEEQTRKRNSYEGRSLIAWLANSAFFGNAFLFSRCLLPGFGKNSQFL